MNQGAARRVAAIAFDWGGVFTEGTFDGRAVQALARLFRLDRERLAEVYFPLMQEFEVGAFDLRGFHRRLAQELRMHGTRVPNVGEAAFRAAFLGAPLERAAAFEILDRIPGGYAVAMLSNNVAELCDQVRADARFGRVEHFVFSNEIAARKPDAAAFATLSEVLGVPPEATVFVDDNEANVAASTALGYRGLLFDTPGGFARSWVRLLPDLGHLVAGPAWAA